MYEPTKSTAPTLRQILLEYFETRILAERTIYQYNCLLEVGLKDWLNLPVTAITKAMVQERHRLLSLRGKTTANCTMRVLKSLLNYASVAYEVDEVPLIAVNPVKRLSDNRLWNKENVRYGRITVKQMPDFIATIQRLAASGEANQTHADYLIFLLFTGLRKSEAAGLLWTDVDWKTGSITLATTKNGQPHCLPLSTYLLDMLRRRREDSTSAWVFPHRYGCGPVAEPRDLINKITAQTGIKFICHDLRRTFIDMCVDCGLNDSTQKQLINHKPRDVTSQHYRNKQDPDQLRPAVQKVSEYILAIASRTT